MGTGQDKRITDFLSPGKKAETGFEYPEKVAGRLASEDKVRSLQYGEEWTFSRTVLY